MAFDPAGAGCGLQRTASSPSSTATVPSIREGGRTEPRKDLVREGLAPTPHGGARAGPGGNEMLAEREGFEPTRAFHTLPVFETGALGRAMRPLRMSRNQRHSMRQAGLRRDQELYQGALTSARGY